MNEENRRPLGTQRAIARLCTNRWQATKQKRRRAKRRGASVHIRSLGQPRMQCNREAGQNEEPSVDENLSFATLTRYIENERWT